MLRDTVLQSLWAGWGWGGGDSRAVAGPPDHTSSIHCVTLGKLLSHSALEVPGAVCRTEGCCQDNGADALRQG